MPGRVRGLALCSLDDGWLMGGGVGVVDEIVFLVRSSPLCKRQHAGDVLSVEVVGCIT